MRIDRIVVDHLRLELDPPFHAAWDPEPRRTFDATLVRVTTDSGITGVGSGDTMAGFEVDAGRFLGTDPRRIEAQVRRIESIDFHRGRCWPLEAALWDVVGKDLGVPAWRLLGGLADRMPAYASTGARRDAAAHAEVARAVVADGFRAIKLRVDPRRPGTAIAEVAAVREAVGPDVDVMVDLNQAWRMAGDTAGPIDVVAARRLADAFAELGVCWLEEPLLGTDLAGLGALRRDARVRIAGGEMTRTTDQVLAAMDADAYDVHQPDVVLSCGMWRVRTLIELATRRGRRLTPHTWTNGIGLLANLHVAVGAGAGPYLEFPYDPDGWTTDRRDFPLATPVGIDPAGDVVAPDAPGLGVVLDDERIAATRVGGWEVTR